MTASTVAAIVPESLDGLRLNRALRAGILRLRHRIGNVPARARAVNVRAAPLACQAMETGRSCAAAMLAQALRPLTALAIAPSRLALAFELGWFAAVWLVAAAVLFAQKRAGVATHAIIGLLMLGLGLVARFQGLPWELLALGISVCSLALAARRAENLVSLLAGVVLVLYRREFHSDVLEVMVYTPTPAAEVAKEKSE